MPPPPRPVLSLPTRSPLPTAKSRPISQLQHHQIWVETRRLHHHHSLPCRTRHPKFPPPAETTANTTPIFINHHQRSQHQKPVTVSGPVCPCSNLIPLLQPNYRARVDMPTRTSQTTTTKPLSPHRLTSSSSRRPDPQPPRAVSPEWFPAPTPAMASRLLCSG
ncbi:leucine-rich repeat extensin-like protein 3 [Iris pallida]|uniref:Leucine-rich repeat extensin-like protein 3 n=1 Tax=Iris pallida TaxID=29817 RepID=A0AAX6I7B5_IRIPA|nr:leucine-rich repeat extensin-like protein 3 [Iris pallida]